MFTKSLEDEFEQYKTLHKLAILKAVITQYYKDVEDNSAKIPDFMRRGQRPEDLAEKDVRELVLRPDNLKKFNELYELAYQQLAEVLP